MDYYLNLVDQERWEGFVGRGTDASDEPATWGFAKRSRVAPGDRLVCLLMGRQMWCGVLKVLGGPLAPDDPRVASDPEFPVRFPVRALVALPADGAIDVFHPSVWPFLSRVEALGIEPRSPGWNTRAGLYPDLAGLDAADGDLLVDRLSARRRGVPLPDDADAKPFDPSDVMDTRARAIRQIAERRGQQAFRDGLLRAYGRRCAITGCGVVDVLEAAHITPHLGPETNHVTNGLLLRADIHTLFDLGLIGVEPDGLAVVVHERLRGSEYEALRGRRIAVPAMESEAPSVKALRWHLEKSGLAAGPDAAPRP